MGIPLFNTEKYDRYYCALVTPYKSDSLEIDEDRYRDHVKYFTKSPGFLKIKGALIANPEASETFYFTQDERDMLTKIALEERPSDMPVFSGFYGVRRDELIESALRAKSLGADGLFVFPPSGFAEVGIGINSVENPEIWTDHVKAIAEATQLPLILHPAAPTNPQWGRSLPVNCVKMLMEQVPSIVGYKMIYGNVDAHFRIARFLRTLPRHVAILNAPRNAYHDAFLLGLIDGAVSGGFNYVMEPWVEHELALKEGDWERAKRFWTKQVYPIQQCVDSDSAIGRHHIAYKIATWIRGFISHPFMRPPMPPPREKEAEEFYKVISEAGLSHITHSEFEATLARKDQIVGRPIINAQA